MFNHSDGTSQSIERRFLVSSRAEVVAEDRDRTVVISSWKDVSGCLVRLYTAATPDRGHSKHKKRVYYGKASCTGIIEAPIVLCVSSANKQYAVNVVCSAQ